MRNRIVFMALAAALALPVAAIAEPPQPPPPGWDRALTAVQTHWQKKHPDDLLVSIKRFSSLFMDSKGDWFDVTYPFELAVKRKGVAQVFKVGARFRKPTSSSPFAFTGINEDVSDRLDKTEVALPLLDSNDARLFRALQDRDLAAVQAALAAGANAEAKDENESPALLVATDNCDPKIVKLLLDKGAVVNATAGSGGMTPLMNAVSKPCDREIVRLLLDKGADINFTSTYGLTALMAAAMGEDATIVNYLLDKGAKVNGRNDDGITALMVVKSAPIAKLLVDRGADVKAKAERGRTALMAAAMDGRAEVVEVLLKKGSDINGKSADGESALTAAVERGHTDVARLLVARGADVQAKNAQGRTGLMVAAKWGRLDIVKLLVEKGADVQAKDSEGKTALKIADEAFQREVVAFLLEREKHASTSSPQAGAPKAPPPAPPAGKPGLNAETCADPCALLTLYAYDELAANACRLCKKLDDTFCEMDFPFNDVPACDAYDELRNCIYARFGYVFAKPKWQQQFGKMPWYKPDPAFTEAKLPSVAKGNVQKLKDLKAKRQGCQ